MSTASVPALIPAPAATTIYVRPGYNRVLAEEFEALKLKRVELVKDKVEAHSQGDLRENFGFKAAKDAIRAVDRKMTALDRFVARNTFIEVDPTTWLTKPTDTVQLGHVITLEKQDAMVSFFEKDRRLAVATVSRSSGNKSPS